MNKGLYNLKKICYNDVVSHKAKQRQSEAASERQVKKVVSSEYMTGKEIVNLIEKLETEGMPSDKIIEIIKYIELTDPKNKV